MKALNIAAAALTAGLVASGAQAGLISAGSTISLHGTNTFDSASITFTGMGNIGAATGDFASMGTCTGCVTLTSFNSASTSFVPYAATNGGVSTDLTLASALFNFVPGDLQALTIVGEGTATLTGFDPTPGSFILTTQGDGSGAEFTFSSTTAASAVPEPATLGLFGLGLLGAFWLSRRRPQKLTDHLVATAI